MKRSLLGIVLVVLLACSFVSQVSVVLPDMSELESVKHSEKRKDGMECLGHPVVLSELLGIEEDNVIGRNPVAAPKANSMTACSTATLEGYEDNNGLWHENLDETCSDFPLADSRVQKRCCFGCWQKI